MRTNCTEIRRQWWGAILASVCACAFWVADKKVEEQYWRLYIVLFTGVPVYHWIKWLRMSIESSLMSSLAHNPADKSNDEG